MMLFRILGTFVKLSFSILIASLLFAWTAVKQPELMRGFLRLARELGPWLEEMGLPADYMVWMDILLTDDKVVFAAYIIAVRMLMSLLGHALFGSGEKQSA